jgi:hypothetical protein
MENVVYILGAGFSAHLGLPVMNNFLIKSKDMYFECPSKYKYFANVFETIKDLSITKNFYETDLFNIEEILSIIEMNSHLKGQKIKEHFLRYIKDVIDYYTPALEPYGVNLPGNWEDFIFGKSAKWKLYGHFIGSMLNIGIKEIIDNDYGRNRRYYICEPLQDNNFKYSIITLNYDVIPESIIAFLSDNYSNRNIEIDIAKLHGCIRAGNIVPPTWNKGGNKGIVPAWKKAHEVLSEANYIRVIGYSLPTSDSYVKYLLKSAAIDSKHLKSFDVLCSDSDGSVKKRYDQFINFKYFRFKNTTAETYLGAIHQAFKDAYQGARIKSVTLRFPEQVHATIFANCD